MKQLSLFLSLLIGLGLLAACVMPAAAPQTAVNERVAEPTGTESYPVTVENCGNTLTVEKRPERVIVSWGGQAAYLLGLVLQRDFGTTRNDLGIG